MEVHSSGNHTHVTSSADRLAIESKSTNLSEHLTVEQPVSKRKRKRRRKRRKKPVPLSSPILTKENSSPKPLKLDDKPPPDPQQQTKRDTLKEDGDAVPIYHTSGRSLSRKLVSTTGSGKASDRLRSTSGGKPSDHLISTEKNTSGDLKTTGKKAISDRVRMTGTGSMAAKVMMEEKMDSSLEESAKTGFSSEKSRSKRYRFKNVRSPEMLGWEEDAPTQEKNASFASVSALSAGSKAAERRRQIQKRVLSQNRQQFVPTGASSAPMEQRLDSSYPLSSTTSAPLGQMSDGKYPLSPVTSAPLGQMSDGKYPLSSVTSAPLGQMSGGKYPLSSATSAPMEQRRTGRKETSHFAPPNVSRTEKLLRRSIRQRRIRDKEAQTALEAGQQSAMLQSTERVLHQQMVDQQEKIAQQNAEGVSKVSPSVVSLSEQSPLVQGSNPAFRTSDRLYSGRGQRFHLSEKTFAPLEQMFQGAYPLSAMTSAPMGQKSETLYPLSNVTSAPMEQKWSGTTSGRAWQRIVLKKQMERQRLNRTNAPMEQMLESTALSTSITSAPMGQMLNGSALSTPPTSAPMEHRWNNPHSAPAWQRIVLQKQMEQRRQLQAAAAQSALNDSQSALLPSEQVLHQQLVDAQTRKVSGQSLLKDAVQKKRADGVSFTSVNYGQSLNRSTVTGIQTDTNTVHDSVHSASLAERVLLFGSTNQTGSEKQQNTPNSKGWHNHSQDDVSSKEHTGSPTQSDRQAGTGRNHGWRGKAAALFALRTARDAERRMQQSAQQEQDETARQVAQFKQSTARNARASVQAAKSGTQIGRSGWKLTQKAAKKAQKAGISAVRVAVTETIKKVVQMVTVAMTSAVGTVLAPLGIIALVIVMITTLITGVIIPSVSHYGIFLVNEQEQEIEFSTALNRLSSGYFSRIYELEMEDDYEEITVDCGITDSDEAWKKIISVYAVNATKQGFDAITMDADHYTLLKDTFWDTITISHHVTTTYETVIEEIEPERTEYQIHYYNADGVEVLYPVLGGTERVETIIIPAVTETKIIEHKKLKITVRETSLNDLENHYLFDTGEKASVKEMLDEPDDVWATLSDSFPNLIISSGVGGAVGSINVEGYATVGETVYRALIAEGYTPQAACGILGNIQQECSMNPNCVTGGAYGMCQWMGGRLDNLKRLANYQTAAVQTGFMISELRSQTSIWTIYGGEVNHTYAGVRITSLAAFKSCTNVRAAAGAFCICFERSNEFPGNQWYEARLRYAEQWYTYAQSHWQ